MRHFKITIEYDGTNFNGWQVQASPQRTVQGEIERALKKIFKKRIRVTGSGRTDTGVHARGQVAGFKVTAQLATKDIEKALNYYLPEDIVVQQLVEISEDFHARYGVKSKIYQYRILNQDYPSPLARKFCWLVRHKINLKIMKQEAKLLVGKNDFRGFMNLDPARQDAESRNTVRTIKNLDIRKEGNYILISIEADGFLYKMVRTIVGTLVSIGIGKMAKGVIQKILKSKDRRLAAAPAPAQGLYLTKVKY